MPRMRLEPCPFCGAKVKPDLDLLQLSDDSWVLNHFCKHPRGGMGVVVTVYGATKKETAQRWNTRATSK